jgi:hypothetical protein
VVDLVDGVVLLEDPEQHPEQVVVALAQGIILLLLLEQPT